MLDYPSMEEEIRVVKNTTSDFVPELNKIISGPEILYFQHLIRRIPIPDNVLEYAVKLAAKTRPNTTIAPDDVNSYLSWGAGPRASQFLVVGTKCHAAFAGKYAPDIEDVKVIAPAILRHRIVKNYKAEAEGISVETIIAGLL